MEHVRKYRSADGVEFDNRSDCEKHEAGLAIKSVCHLDVADINAALDGRNPLVADSLERIGNRLGDLRRERGELRRVKKEKAS